MTGFEDNQFTGMKILIIEDEPNNIDILLHLLEKIGINILIGTSGENGLKIIEKDKPDLILPGINGYETCARLQNDPSTKNIPIIFLTAKNLSSDIIKGFQAGGVDYITKPFNQEEVLARVKTQLQLQSKRKLLEESQNEIKRYAENLERSNQDLEQFAAVASHDLKSPLRQINMLGTILMEDFDQLSIEKKKDMVGMICSLTKHLFKLTDSILEFSKVGERHNKFEPCDLNSLVQRVIENLSVTIQETDANIIVESLPILEGEPSLLYQLFQNMIENAVKFHHKGQPPFIKISSQSCEDGNLEIRIEDNGIGFGKEYSERIFQPFKRLVNSSEFEGSGLGLATCQKIIAIHRGTIVANSELNKGTTFIITLPDNHPH